MSSLRDALLHTLSDSPEMPLTMQCLGAPDDAGRFLPLQPPCLQDGSTSCSQNDGGYSGSKEKHITRRN